MNDIAPTASSLITIDEADQIIKEQESFLAKYRTPLLIVSGLAMIVTITLLVMLVLSLRGARTGLSTIVPSLEQPQDSTLQLPQN